MKKLNQILSLAVCFGLMMTSFVSFTSCSEDELDTQVEDNTTTEDPNEDPSEEPNEEPEEAVVVFTVSSISDYIGGSAGDSATFTVTSSEAWSIASDDYFECSPASGDGADDAVTVTVSAIADNATFEEVISTLVISNAEGTEKTVMVVQSTEQVLEFDAMESAEVASGGETLVLAVTATMSDWVVTSSLEGVEMAYDYTASTVSVNVPVNFTFEESRTIELTIATAEGVEGGNSLSLTQPRDFELYVSGTGEESVTEINEDGSITIKNDVANSRIVTKSALGYGTYSLITEAIALEDATAYLQIQGWADTTNSTYNFMLYSTAVGYAIFKGYGSGALENISNWPGVGKYTLDGSTAFVWTILPTADGCSEMNMTVTTASGDILISTNTLTTGEFWEQGLDVDAINLYMGLQSVDATTPTGKSVTFKSFSFEPYAE